VDHSHTFIVEDPANQEAAVAGGRVFLAAHHGGHAFTREVDKRFDAVSEEPGLR